MRNFELDKTVTLREVEAALASNVRRHREFGYHTVDVGDFGTLDVKCDSTEFFEDFMHDVLQELL